ncbi:putative metal-dependent hydrolase [candidate division KSB1 bacterium]|nr:putative metal-dependent hydrolase [candidate division KSB1 bacterium]
MSDLRYPTGKFVWKYPLTVVDREQYIETIAGTPAKFRAVVQGLTETQLDTPYRAGGWTARQVIHHVPDSHLNAYVRTKLALTEDVPTIKPYEEAAWAALPDNFNTPVEVSVRTLELVHERWVNLLRALKPADFKRRFIHPAVAGDPRTLDWLLGLYAWHGPHHIAHIESVKY